jgi:hypothetical protein
MSFGGSFGVERGFVFRPPATAQLSIDSADRPNPTSSSPYNFQITRQQSIFNGFFTRVSATEVVLEWCQDNISQSTVGVDISGVALSITIPRGQYTVAELLNEIVDRLNALNRPAYAFEINNTSQGQAGIFSGSGALDFAFTSDPQGVLASLGITLNQNQPEQPVDCPDIRPYRFIDFVCSQLTYPQALKDATTQLVTRDVLCRWYFAEDSPENFDEYGFPILMGYQRFVRRRLFNPPKYIKWDNNLPVGNLTFEVYGDDGNILAIPDAPSKNNWLMTIQLQES